MELNIFVTNNFIKIRKNENDYMDTWKKAFNEEHKFSLVRVKDTDRVFIPDPSKSFLNTFVLC